MKRKTAAANGKLIEIEILLNLLSDEILLMIYTKNTQGHYSKKVFLADQHKQLKEIIDRIVEHLAHYKRNETGIGDLIKKLLSEHENIISHYREKNSRTTGKLEKDKSNLIKNLLKEHEKMAWALRAQLK